MMKKEDIIKGNKLIAKFMGCTNGPYDKFSQDYLIHFPNNFSIKIRRTRGGNYLEVSWLEFHESWDWLMPVLIKIALLGDGSSFKMTYATGCTDSFGDCVITNFYFDKFQSIVKVVDSPRYGKEDGSEELIYTVYKTVISFIKWYNKQKKNESSD